MSIRNRYALLQAVYWMINLTAFGYGTYFLQESGFRSAATGIILALGGTAASALQNILGRMVDRGVFSWRYIMVVLTLIYAVLCAGLYFCSVRFVTAAVFCFFMCAVNCFMPLLNGVGFYYERRGIAADYGFSRAFGSLGYALLSVILGRITVACGHLSVPAAGILLSFCLLAVLFFMPCEKETQDMKDNGTGSSILMFPSKYPGFILIVAGCTLSLAFHHILGIFMINIVENVGGDSSDMGIANCIAALVEIPVMLSFSRIIRRIPADRLIIAASACYIIRGIIVYNASSVYMIFAAQVLQAFTFAAVMLAGIYYTDDLMKEEDKMKGQALMGSSFTAGYVIGCIFGGIIIQSGGVETAFITGIVFAAAGLVLVLAGFRRKKHECSV